MDTPSKEALNAARDVRCKIQHPFGWQPIEDPEMAAIIDCHFEPLRRDNATLAGRLTAAELERDSLVARAEQAEARVKELEALADAKYAQGYSAANHLNTKRREVDQAAYDELVALRAANAELQKQEAESRRLFYAEQDKRQSAEFRCEELAVTLRRIAAQKPEKPDYWTRCGQCDSNIEDAKEVLARHAAGEPEAQK